MDTYLVLILFATFFGFIMIEKTLAEIEKVLKEIKNILSNIHLK